jgi:hypothetical protein
MTSICQRWGFPGLLVLALLLSSCKAKYLEMESRYVKARVKKTELDKENKALKTENEQLSDSLLQVKNSWDNQEDLYVQTKEIEALKKTFLLKKAPYYLQMKTRQAQPVKPKKK